MKLYGKKLLALIMAVAVVLSLCTFNAFAGSLQEINVGGELHLSAPTGATNINWSSTNPSVATVVDGLVTGVASGKADITVTYTPAPTTENPTPAPTTETWPFTVKFNVATATLKSVSISSSDSSLEVPVNCTASDVANKLKDIVITLTYTAGGVDSTTTTTATWSCTGTFDSTQMGRTFDFVPSISGAQAFMLPKVTVTIGKIGLASSSSANLDAITVMVGTEESDVKELLPEYVALPLSNGKAETFGIGSYSSSSSIDGCFEAWATGGSNAYNDNYEGTYTFTAKFKGHDEYSLPDLTITVKAVDGDFKLNAAYDGASLKTVMDDMDNMLKGMYDEGLDTIDFDDMEMYGGELYIVDDEGYMTLVEEGVYDADSIEDMVYYPNGSGDESEIYYVAYTDEDDEVEGKITIKSDAFALVTWEIDSKDIIELDSDEFDDAFCFMNDDYAELTSIKFSSFSNGKSKGYLYYDYDDEDETGKDASSKTLYYDPDSNDIGIDEVVYIPGEDMESGVYHIAFKADGYDDDDDTVSNKQGYIRIFLSVSADLTIQAGKEQMVKIDPDLFIDFLYEAKRTDDIAYVVITNAPRTDRAGYLYTDGEYLTKRAEKAFYADESDVDFDKKKYDLYDLSFEGGTTNTVTHATFSIYYYKTNGKLNSTPVTGTIDFVSGVTGSSSTTANTSLSDTIEASKTMSFGQSLDAFKDLGNNDNVYVTFSTLPVGGKLVYKWGTSEQADVKPSTAYFIDYRYGQYLLEDVTFIPAYSATKAQKLVTMGVKAINAKGKTVEGTINITVNYATRSAQFTDVNDPTYADSVDFLYNHNITTGTSYYAFSPNSNVTRAQFVTFLWRAAGEPTAYGVTNTFTDVKSTGTYAYAYQAILWAVQNGITTGRSATTFDPGANVTHQELLTFLYRYDTDYLKHSKAKSTSIYYTDFASVSAYAQDAVKWADLKGILTGYTIQPTVAGTRATVALWLHRMLTL